ncbi:MAG: D-alanyl-D-alanine carboxypeptidase, partial [Chlamydiia bacterium]|nr:D-alanyl-D-alanine carboxypeptidase [Chlamydiia bacterium]
MKLPILLVLLIPAFAAAQLDIDVRAEAALLINADTGAILYEKNADLPLYPASITKIATALYTLEKASEKLSETVTISSNAIASISSKAREKSNYTVSPHWIEVGGSHIGLKAGEEVTLETLLYGLMLSSGNDAANALAEYVGEGSMNRFIEEMNAYLRSLGCTQTNFLSAHGHHHPDHITCARDMAIMARVGLKNPHFRKIVSTVTYKRPDTNKQKATTLVQTNKLLRKSSPYYYERAIGVKTGHGSEAKDALVAAAEWKGRTLIAVLMRSEKRQYNFEDAAKLFELAFNQPKLSKTIVAKGPQRYSLKLEGASSTLG